MLAGLHSAMDIVLQVTERMRTGRPSTKEKFGEDSDPDHLAEHTGVEASSRYLKRMNEKRQGAMQGTIILEEALRAGQLSYSTDSSTLDQRTYNRTRDQHYQNQGVLAGLLHAMDIVEQVTRRMMTGRPSTNTEAGRGSGRDHSR